MYKHFFKRVIDVVLSGMALLCLSPVLLVVTIWLYFANRVASPQPSPEGEGEQKSHPSGGDLEGASKGASFWSTVFFTQERPGKGGKIFKVIKFKSMTDERDANGNLLPNEKRITPIGKFIRKFSIDELPQLINVFIGDMSLIGPRPLLVRYLELYSPEQARRHEVRPGITGWAQVNGRNNITWTEKFKLDVWYVDNCTFWVDIKIIFITIKNVVAGKDVAVSTGGFNGNN